jgi:hypothetical protein
MSGSEDERPLSYWTGVYDTLFTGGTPKYPHLFSPLVISGDGNLLVAQK